MAIESSHAKIVKIDAEFAHQISDMMKPLPMAQKSTFNRHVLKAGKIKPTLSNVCLIALALKNSPDGGLSLVDLRDFIGCHFPFYRCNFRCQQIFSVLSKSNRKRSTFFEICAIQICPGLEPQTPRTGPNKSGKTKKNSNSAKTVNIYRICPDKKALIDQKLHNARRSNIDEISDQSDSDESADDGKTKETINESDAEVNSECNVLELPGDAAIRRSMAFPELFEALFDGKAGMGVVREWKQQQDILPAMSPSALNTTMDNSLTATNSASSLSSSPIMHSAFRPFPTSSSARNSLETRSSKKRAALFSGELSNGPVVFVNRSEIDQTPIPAPKYHFIEQNAFPSSLSMENNNHKNMKNNVDNYDMGLELFGLASSSAQRPSISSMLAPLALLSSPPRQNDQQQNDGPPFSPLLAMPVPQLHENFGYLRQNTTPQMTPMQASLSTLEKLKRRRHQNESRSIGLNSADNDALGSKTDDETQKCLLSKWWVKTEKKDKQADEVMQTNAGDKSNNTESDKVSGPKNAFANGMHAGVSNNTKTSEFFTVADEGFNPLSLDSLMSLSTMPELPTTHIASLISPKEQLNSSEFEVLDEGIVLSEGVKVQKPQAIDVDVDADFEVLDIGVVQVNKTTSRKKRVRKNRRINRISVAKKPIIVNEKPFTLPLVKSIIKACRTSHVFVKNDELSATPQSKTMKRLALKRIDLLKSVAEYKGESNTPSQAGRGRGRRPKKQQPTTVIRGHKDGEPLVYLLEQPRPKWDYLSEQPVDFCTNFCENKLIDREEDNRSTLSMASIESDDSSTHKAKTTTSQKKANNRVQRMDENGTRSSTAASTSAIVSSDEEGENEITNQTIDDFNLYLKNGISQEQEDNKQKEVMDFGCEEDRLIAELTRKNEILRSQETKLAYEISDWRRIVSWDLKLID